MNTTQHIIKCLISIACIASSDGLRAAPSNSAQDQLQRKAASQILVRYKANSPFSAGALSSRTNTQQASPAASVSAPIAGLRKIKSIPIPGNARLKQGLRSTRTGDSPGELVVLQMLDPQADRQKLIAQLRASDEVLYAEPDYLLTATALPDDPGLGLQWGLHNIGQSGGVADVDIDAPEAWDNFTTGSESVVVAVVDTGIHYAHPDLIDNMWVNPGESGVDINGLDKANNGVDDDLNGYIDDVHGIDCINEDSDPVDDDTSSHGTHIAGIIGAQGNNAQQVVGVNWDVSLMALKYLGANGRGVTSDAIECLSYMSNMKSQHGINLKLSNNSYGGSDFSQAMYDAIAAMQAQDILFVAAAGNDAEDNDRVPLYPASYDLPNIISVASIDRSAELASSSNYGLQTVDLAAPGVTIFSTKGSSGTGYLSGTSMAAPHVSGVAALLAAHAPDLSYAQLKGRMMDTAVSTPSVQGRSVTGGIVNAHDALSCSTSDADKKAYLEPLPPSEYLRAGRALDIALTVSACGEGVLSETVVVSFDNGAAPLSLLDDGVAPDAVASDGRYTGRWVPSIVGPVELSINAAAQTLTYARTIVEVPDYSVDANHPYFWLDASDGVDLGLGAVDDEGQRVEIGFDFEFYGVQHASLQAHSNGMLKFLGDVELNFFEFLDLPSSRVPNNFIAPFWEDLNPSASDSGKLYSKLQGSAPNRRLIVEWHQLLHFNQESEPLDSSVTFQAILYEGSNDIVLQYKDLSFGSSIYDDAARALIGIESFDGEEGLSYLNQGQPSSNQLQEGQALRFYISDSAQRTLSIDKPHNGTLQGNLNQINCGPDEGQCFGQYAQNTMVQISAIPQAFYAFDAWQGAACVGQTGSVCEVTVAQHEVIGATFTAVPAVVVTPISELRVTEAGATAQVEVRLNTAPSAAVTLTLASSDLGEAVIDRDSLSFTPQNALTAQTVTITGVDDNFDDGDVEFQLVVDAAVSDDPQYQGYDADDLTLHNQDDDTAGVSVTGENLSTDENGAMAQFTISLYSQPSDDVSVSLASSDPSEAVVSAAQIVFTPGNALLPQTLFITGVDDDIVDGDIAYAVQFSALSSNDPLYAGLQVPSIGAVNIDLDQDSDADGRVDSLDNCPNDHNPSQLNSDFSDDGGDACDADDDNDLVLDQNDNCPLDQNPAQKDTDGDQQGDRCDPDSDNDSVFDLDDIDPLDPQRCQDIDNDGCDDCSIGTDGFGVLSDAMPEQDGEDLDGDFVCDQSDPDLDGDEIENHADNCPRVNNPEQEDSNQDGTGDACSLVEEPQDDATCAAVRALNQRVIPICL